MGKRNRDEPRAGRHTECTPKLRPPCTLAYEALEPPHSRRVERAMKGTLSKGDARPAAARLDRPSRPWWSASMRSCRPPTCRPAANAAPEGARHPCLGRSLRGSSDATRGRRHVYGDAPTGPLLMATVVA